jgi:hypothetical protein
VAHSIYGRCKRIDSIPRKIIGSEIRVDFTANYRAEINFHELLGARVPAWLSTISTAYTRQLADIFATEDDFAARARVQIDAAEGELERLADAMRHLELHKELGDEGIFAITMGHVSVGKPADSLKVMAALVPSHRDAAQPLTREGFPYFASFVSLFDKDST